MGEIDKIFAFIIYAYKTTNENLSFLYFMKVVMLLTKQNDCGMLYNESEKFRTHGGILEKFAKFFE